MEDTATENAANGEVHKTLHLISLGAASYPVVAADGAKSNVWRKNQLDTN